MQNPFIEFDENSYLIPSLPDNNVPTRTCRAVICDVCVTETDHEEGLGNIDIAFLVLSPSFDEPYIYEKHFTNWSVYGGIEAAFQCLVPDDLVENFESLIGTVFNAEIHYHAYNSEIYAEIELLEMITPPPTRVS